MKLTRRDFLQAIIVVVPAIEGCAADAEPTPPTPTPKSPPPEDGQRYFPQSVASGDPRPDSVILWTRIIDEEKPGDYLLTLEVATDAEFTGTLVRKSNLRAAQTHDNAMKVKLAGLSPRTSYFYRFIYERDGKKFASRTGRTRTAPRPTDDVPTKFAVASCQDFIGRYYNTWQYLTQLDPDLDFVIFLGDYVYETTGDPSFMTAGGRAVTFTDAGSALTLTSGAVTYAAAQSVSNYRDLYRTVRSDAFLRAAHERYPFVFIWDDHEYSDDCHGATATYFDGRIDETKVERRRNAEQAFFEYVPLDHPASAEGTIDFDQLARYPDTKIYRDLVFGKHLRLLVADYRTYRPDHLIPEDAYPAKVVLPQEALASAGLDAVFTSDTFAYVDIDAAEYAIPKAFLFVAYQQLAQDAGLDEATAEARATEAIQGPLALVYVNAVLTNPKIGLAPIDPAGKPRGLAYIHMGKRDLFTRQGSRYVLVKDTFDAYSAAQYNVTSGASENVYGAAQQAWLEATLASPETWKVLVSSVSLTSIVFDLRDKMDIPDATLRNRYYLNGDQWDGFPTRRRELLAKLGATAGGKAFAVSGDIHSSFASVEGGVACLTAPAISSLSVQGGARLVALGAGFDETSSIYRYVVTELNQTLIAGNPGIAFSDADSHGFLIVEVKADEALATFHLVPSSEVVTDYAARGGELQAKFQSKRFRVTPGMIVPA